MAGAFVLGFFLQVSAQQAPRKFLLLVHAEMSDPFSFGIALGRAMELKQADVEVQVVFEGEAVSYFLGREEFLPFEKPARTMNPAGTDYTTVNLSTECNSGPMEGMSCVKVLRNGVYVSSLVPLVHPSGETPAPRYTINLPSRKGTGPKSVSSSRRELLWTLLADFTAARIPYTICSLSAAQMGIYDKLKARGLPLSADPAAPVGIVPFINDNYQVIGY